MESCKSLEDQYKPIITALLCDVQTLHSDVFTRKAFRCTLLKACKRIDSEGISFLTKTLPRLGKALDRALSSKDPLTCPYERKLTGTQLPRFLGELFSKVFSSDARVLPTPCVASIKTLRNVLYFFYKVKYPHTSAQEQDVISTFLEGEKDVQLMNAKLDFVKSLISNHLDRCCAPLGVAQTKIVRRARTLVHRVLQTFDPTDIIPRHGPGAVSTKEKLWEKWRWTDIPERIANVFPIDSYFYCNLDHVADRVQEIKSLGSCDTPAQVILVPKDSRGPRLISCEPLYNQWIQQGISRALVRHVERHHLTCCRVNFTDQQPNQHAALVGSLSGEYATLDLKEASDRISLGLVHLLFPDSFIRVLESVRSQSTRLPNGKVIALNKHAPMGSALCFPILALSIWAILNAAAGNDTDARERILVYGDDVIVPRAFAPNAIEQLTWFGLVINQAKSCTEGLFRESCGVDAYSGINVTPTRLRVPPSSVPRPDHYVSWISTANQLYDRGWYSSYDYIVNELERIYGPIPSEDMNIRSCPSVRAPSLERLRFPRRYNKHLQKCEFKVREIRTTVSRKTVDGWMMLLRYFTESKPSAPLTGESNVGLTQMPIAVFPAQTFEYGHRASVNEYTSRHAIKFAWRWR
jgi:hypothetical protein